MATKMADTEIINKTVELCTKGLLKPNFVAKVATHAWLNNITPERAMERMGLSALHDPGDPKQVVREVIENNKYAFCMTVVGIKPISKFFTECMKHAKGKCNPSMLKEELLAVVEEWKTNKSGNK